MKNKIFDRKLYMDSLRRTAIIGGLFTVLLTIAGLLMFFAFTMDLKYIEPERVEVQLLNFYEINPFLIAIAYSLCPLLCLNLFGFLNKRSTSDFWHSVPFTRVCLFNTFSLTALTWSAVATLVSSAVSIICFLTVPSFYAINWASVLSTLLALLASQILVVAGVNIAMSVTGTYFSNVVVSALILFLPRVLLLFFAYASTNSHLFVFSLESSWLSPAHNLVTGMILSMGDIPDMLTSYGSTVYTAVLGIIYYFIGMIIFAKRKSESAGNSAVNKYMQATFRIIVCFTVCLFPIYLIAEELNRNRQYFGRSDWFTIFVLYVIAAAAYFVYELITTKKLKNLLKAIPALGIVALLNFATISGAHLAYRVEYDYTPTPENVSEIQLGSPEETGREYFSTAVANLVISDNEIEQLLCDTYFNTRRAYETEGIRYGGDLQITVGFKTNGIYHYRHVYMDTETNDKLTALLYKNESFRKIFDIDEIIKKEIGTSFGIHLPYNYPEDSEKSKELRDKLMQAYIEDVKNLDFETWYKLATSGYYNQVEWTDENGITKYAYNVGELGGYIPMGGIKTYFDLPICNLTPKTVNMVMEMVAEYQKSENRQKETIEALKKDDFGFENKDGKYYHNISIELYNGTTMTRPEQYNFKDYEQLNKMIEVLEQTYDQVPDADSRFAVVHYSYEKGSKDQDIIEYYNYSTVFKIPDDADLTFLLGKDLMGDNVPNIDMEIDYDKIISSY